MSVTLTTYPPFLAFSGDQMKVVFTCTDMMQSEGVKAVNTLEFFTAMTAGETITFAFGGNTLIMTAADSPDDSGNQFHSGNIVEATQLHYFQTNYLLSENYDISLSSDSLKIIFTAKKKALGFSFTPAAPGKFQIANPTPGVIPNPRPNYGVMFRLWCEDPTNEKYEMIYSSRITVTYGSNIAELPIGDKLNDYISDEISKNFPDIPGADPIVCKKSCRRYYFEYAESYGDPIVFRKIQKSGIYAVLHGGLSTIGKATKTLLGLIAPGDPAQDRFLKQGATIVLTRSNQRQYLYFVNTRTAVEAVLKCRLRFTDGTKALIEIGSQTLSTFRKYAFNVSYEQIYQADDYPGQTLLGYETWIADHQDQRLSETRTFLMDYRPLQFIRYFLNWSSWGSMDSRMFYGKGSSELELAQSVASRSTNDQSQLSRPASLVYDLRISTTYTLTTGFIQDRSSLIFNRDFFVSALKYRVAGENLLPVKVTSKTIPELEDGNNLLAQKFEYEYLFEDQAYTEGDDQEPGIIYSQINSGFSDTYLTDKEKVFLLTTQNEFITLS